jgi:heme-degrading monooxygenase HmoA
MIVRMWETRVQPGKSEELIRYVAAEVWPSVAQAAGFLGGEVLRSYASGDERVLLVTRWQSEAALEAFLGPDWRAHEMTPVPGEQPLLAGVPFVDHWVPLPLD